MKRNQSLKYNASSIDMLRFPDVVRVNPSMYIGSVDEHGRWLIARELMDNGLDEALAGRNKGVIFVEDKDGSYWVLDEGSGIPQGVKSYVVNINGKQVKTKLPSMQAIFSEMHTSGKFRSDAYKTSVGTHGCGSKGTNATSTFFNVVTKYEGAWYSIGFKKGLLTSAVTKLSRTPKGPTGKPLKRGTCIHFKPDPEIFGGRSDINLKYAHQWSEIMSYLTPGFTVLIMDKKGKVTRYHSDAGPSEYVSKLIQKLKVQAEERRFEYHNELCDCVLAFSNAEGLNIRGYTNGLLNSQGGKHVDSVCSALLKALKPYAKRNQTVSAYDIKEGLLGIINIKLHKAEFSSQDKSRLTDERAGKTFEDSLLEQFNQFFAKNKTLARRLCEKATKLGQLRTQFKASKKVVQALNAVKRKGMPAKYAPADSRSKLDDRELLIVEGESASGGLREKRRPYQSLYPIRGKVQNCLKSGDKALESEEVIGILGAIGYDPKATDPISKLIVNKIICLADGDPDGSHINSLLLALFYKYLPELFNQGRIFVADMPEFYAQYKDHLILGDTLSEISGKLKKLKAPQSTSIHHIKGWGEIDASLMEALAVNQETRRLIQIQAIQHRDNVEFVACMNDDVAFRRKMLRLPE